RVAVQKIPFSDRTDFAVAKKARDRQRPEFFLNVSGVMALLAKETVAAPVAAAQASAVKRPACQPLLRALQQRGDVFRPGCGIAALKLHRLARAWQRADGQRARLWICADDVADQEIATMKFFQVLVDYKPHE